MEKVREAILKERYYLQVNGATVETTEEQMFRRVANAVGFKYGEEWKEKFFNILMEYRFSPNSPVYFNTLPSGKPFMGSACFVLDIHDSMKGIMKTAEDMSLVFKYGGGVGIPIDKLRPKEAIVSTGSGYSSGPVSFMGIYNKIATTVVQGGKRRAALMVCMNDSHPDILDFIKCKATEGDLAGMNISVKISDALLNAIKNKKQFQLSFPPYIKSKMVDPNIIYGEIVNSSWNNGEPGIIFIDTINKFNPLPSMPIEACNPCGEEPLWKYNSCNLGSINLAHGDCIQGGKVNTDYIEKIAYDCTWFLNGVIDNFYMPITSIQTNTTKNIRPAGLGITGFAELLYSLNIVYGSKECMSVVDKVGEAITLGSTKASIDVAKKVGKFGFYNKSIWTTKEGREKMGVHDPELHKAIEEHGVANATLTTIAPTGTVSYLLKCTTTGIEPAFSLVYEKKYLQRDGATVSDIIEVPLPKGVVTDEVIQNGGSIKKLVNKDKWMVYRTAMEISPEEHLAVQAQWQKHIHAAISKTINLPNETTKPQVAELIQKAHTLGCKGLTLYRDGSRDLQILTKVEKRPTKVKGDTFRIKTFTDTTVYLTINEWGSTPKEIFISVGKQSNEFSIMCEGLGRIISIALQSGASLERIISSLEGHKGDLQGNVSIDGKMVPFQSSLDLLARILSVYKPNGKEHTIQSVNKDIYKSVPGVSCPNCMSLNIARQEGCTVCRDCGYSKCN
jgi:ribonucleoside-diphosphate reductase alpha chain